MKWFLKKPLVSSHTNFKINLKGKLHISSLPLTKGNAHIWGEEAKAVTSLTHCKSVPFWREALCLNRIWGSRAAELFPAMPLASAALQGTSRTRVVTVKYMGDIKALLFGRLQIPEQEPAVIDVGLGWQLHAQLGRDSRGTELWHCPACTFSRFMRRFWCADRTGEVNYPFILLKPC